MITADDAQALAEQHGTPFYLYELSVLRERARRLRAAMPATLLYAVKANPNEAVLRALHGLVDGLDVASLGELELALRCGWAPQQLSFAGPGKTQHELEAAIRHGVLLSVESIRELDALSPSLPELSRSRGGEGRGEGKPQPRPRLRLRLNPSLRAQAYRVPMIGGPSPFGIDEEELALATDHLLRHASTIDFDGIHVHPGGQCTSVGAFSAAAAATLDLAEQVHRRIPVRTINFGGGFGVLGSEELDVEAAGKRLGAMLEKYRASTGQALEAVVEPGRWLVAPAGLYVARVVSEKRSRGKHFVVLDGGMNHHLGATGHLGKLDLPLVNLSRPGAPRVMRTVVGPLCTPLDTLGADVELAEPQLGDLIGVRGSGAYGYSFSPLHFLGHPLPAEVVR
ncbi:MAG: alanine racemase [Archangium sp.]|nr:alanine racemase [Archangium sp.]